MYRDGKHLIKWCAPAPHPTNKFLLEVALYLRNAAPLSVLWISWRRRVLPLELPSLLLLPSSSPSQSHQIRLPFLPRPLSGDAERPAAAALAFLGAAAAAANTAAAWFGQRFFSTSRPKGSRSRGGGSLWWWLHMLPPPPSPPPPTPCSCHHHHRRHRRRHHCRRHRPFHACSNLCFCSEGYCSGVEAVI